jgi:hypothetical protein
LTLTDTLVVVAFVLHLIAVDIAAAGPLLCVALEWRGLRRSSADADRLAKRFAKLTLYALAVGASLGGLLLIILHHRSPAYWSAVERVPAQRWWFAGAEVMFFVACMLCYIALWDRMRRWPFWHRLLAIAAATNLMYHFPPLFTMISLLSTRSELADTPLDRALYVQFLFDREFLARVAHHWLASLATSSVALMLVSAQNAGLTQPNRSRSAFLLGSRVALAATVLQLPTGLWLLFASPSSTQTSVSGGDFLGTAVFAAALMATVFLLQQLLTAALGDTRRKTAFTCAAALFVVLVLMGAVLHRTARFM